MKMMVLAGVALLAATLNVQAVGPNNAVNETQVAIAKATQNAAYKVRPIAPMWQRTAAGELVASAPRRPLCSKLGTQESCEMWGCVWTDGKCADE